MLVHLIAQAVERCLQALLGALSARIKSYDDAKARRPAEPAKHVLAESGLRTRELSSQLPGCVLQRRLLALDDEFDSFAASGRRAQFDAHDVLAGRQRPGRDRQRKS